MAKKNSLVDWDGLRIVGSFSDIEINNDPSK